MTGQVQDMLHYSCNTSWSSLYVCWKFCKLFKFVLCDVKHDKNDKPDVLQISYYRHYSNRMVDPICGRNSIFGIFVNPIMRKVAPLIIFEWIQFSDRTCSSRNHKALLAQQNSEVMAKMSLLILSGSVLIKTTPAEALCSDDWSSRSLYTSKVT